MTQNNLHEKKLEVIKNPARFLSHQTSRLAHNPYLDPETAQKIKEWQEKVIAPSKL